MSVEQENNLFDNKLTSNHCFSCRFCCKFSPEDTYEAPLFTSNQKDQAIKEHPEKELGFKPKGNLWQIELRRLPGEKEMYVCPLYDNDSGKCGVYEYRPFECRTWPFYVMKKEDKFFITLDPDCPIINGLTDKVIARMVEKNIIPYMLAETTQVPEYVLEHDGQRKIVADITEVYNNRSNKMNQSKTSHLQR